MSVERRYDRKHFAAQFVDSVDSFTVYKILGDDWSHIKAVTNGEPNGEITLRSREAAISLHHLLGRLLADEGDG